MQFMSISPGVFSSVQCINTALTLLALLHCNSSCFEQRVRVGVAVDEATKRLQQPVAVIRLDAARPTEDGQQRPTTRETHTNYGCGTMYYSEVVDLEGRTLSQGSKPRGRTKDRAKEHSATYLST